MFSIYISIFLENETNSLKPTNVYQSKLTKKEELQLLDIQ